MPKQIEADGLTVELRTKQDLIEVIDDMIAEEAEKVKAGNVRRNSGRQYSNATLSFFGSVRHYLNGGIE